LSSVADHRSLLARLDRRPGRALKTGCVNNHWFTLRAETVARERLLAGLNRDLAALPG
jgi:hypothetical protein